MLLKREPLVKLSWLQNITNTTTVGLKCIIDCYEWFQAHSEMYDCDSYLMQHLTMQWCHAPSTFKMKRIVKVFVLYMILDTQHPQSPSVTAVTVWRTLHTWWQKSRLATVYGSGRLFDNTWGVNTESQSGFRFQTRFTNHKADKNIHIHRPCPQRAHIEAWHFLKAQFCSVQFTGVDFGDASPLFRLGFHNFSILRSSGDDSMA